MASSVDQWNPDRDTALIPRFYAGREVFITGATGFVGQVLTERLLSTCPDISCLHLLVRVKENESLKTKLNKIKDLQLFDVLRGKNPKQLEKLNLIPGDITRPNLGLNETSVAELHNVSVVFHLAATIKFNEQLEVAVKINTLGPMCLLDICDRLPKMAALIHVSTAYCEAERALIEEAVYPLPRDLDTMIQESLHGGRRTELQLKRFLSPKMNTYMLTKSMAESAIKLHGNRGYPIAILRPSIVASSLRDPFPGWVQGFQGAVGIVTNVSLGLMHVMGCRPDYPIDLLPVDIAADTAIAVAWETAVDNLPEVRVYNCCTMENPINYGDAFRYMVQEAREYPSSSIMWYPFIFHASKSYILKLLEFLLEVIPMYVAEYAMKTFGNKGKRLNLMRVSRRQVRSREVLFPFTSRHLRFVTRNMSTLRARLTPADAAIYNTDPASISWKQYFKDFSRGIRLHIIKDKDEDPPAAKKRLNRLLCVHVVVCLSFLVLLAWLIVRMTAVVSSSPEALRRVAGIP
ncbi:unnamed protein product [Chilo suppressalis]|uniref:Fatty acyl-CoA reductase n=1 Tax=Chilo suppressalis TaxID=168631 RepID=A0ABN8B933_CHISP|nr:unnamed protein product [Chilo suppressalis]